MNGVLSTAPSTLHKHQLQTFFQVIGCKVKDAVKFAQDVLIQAGGAPDSTVVVLNRSATIELATSVIKMKPSVNQLQQRITQKAGAAFDIVTRKASFTLLLGGTSGCGKSTIASVLGARLGINTVISTDSIRHVLRTCLDTSDPKTAPLWVSTYETGQLVSMEEHGEEMNPKDRLIEGYSRQCRMVCDHLDRVISNYEAMGESLIIEGVHLTPDEMLNLSKKHKSIIPFLIIVSDEKKHVERMAVRAKYMSLDPNRNKYVANISNIRTIQKRNLTRANIIRIPCVDNTNLDRSVDIIHRTFSNALPYLSTKSLLDPQANDSQPLLGVFLFTKNNRWSAKSMLQTIKESRKSVERGNTPPPSIASTILLARSVSLENWRKERFVSQSPMPQTRLHQKRKEDKAEERKKDPAKKKDKLRKDENVERIDKSIERLDILPTSIPSKEDEVESEDEQMKLRNFGSIIKAIRESEMGRFWEDTWDSRRHNLETINEIPDKDDYPIPDPQESDVKAALPESPPVVPAPKESTTLAIVVPEPQSEAKHRNILNMFHLSSRTPSPRASSPDSTTTSDSMLPSNLPTSTSGSASPSLSGQSSHTSKNSPSGSSSLRSNLSALHKQRINRRKQYAKQHNTKSGHISTHHKHETHSRSSAKVRSTEGDAHSSRSGKAHSSESAVSILSPPQFLVAPTPQEQAHIKKTISFPSLPSQGLLDPGHTHLNSSSPDYHPSLSPQSLPFALTIPDPSFLATQPHSTSPPKLAYSATIPLTIPCVTADPSLSSTKIEKQKREVKKARREKQLHTLDSKRKRSHRPSSTSPTPAANLHQFHVHRKHRNPPDATPLNSPVSPSPPRHVSRGGEKDHSSNRRQPHLFSLPPLKTEQAPITEPRGRSLVKQRH
ncbi:putative 2-phosphoglycerate kinase [Blattamonas nauphoetae]|uniref:2-phosphoglycerate kinase n=1 Tax=Blattamonas nauphoetae TaxID=2049346 RepID=A0ABQ9YCR1_9EUKA|nr:putative 2-phosphoglycerate kinase [Blattamonas nauphoetae]